MMINRERQIQQLIVEVGKLIESKTLRNSIPCKCGCTAVSIKCRVCHGHDFEGDQLIRHNRHCCVPMIETVMQHLQTGEPT